MKKEAPSPDAYLLANVSGKVIKIVLGMTKIVDEKVWGSKNQKWI